MIKQQQSKKSSHVQMGFYKTKQYIKDAIMDIIFP